MFNIFHTNKMITEYDAFEEAKRQMAEYERKYDISSEDLYNGKYDTITFENDDKYFWESYIRNFLKCGGSFETARENAEC